MLLHAGLYVAEVVFQMQCVVALRIGRGVQVLSHKPEYDHLLPVRWCDPQDRGLSYVAAPGEV